MRVHLGQRDDELTRVQAGRIATANDMDSAPSTKDQYWELPAGTKVTLEALWSGNKGFRSFLSQLETLAAQCGAVVRHPGDPMYPHSDGNVTPASFFVVVE